LLRLKLGQHSRSRRACPAERHDKWKAVWPAISTGGNVYVVSTTNGVGNWFEETVRGAQEGTNKFFLYHGNYLDHPDHQNPEWVAEMRKRLGEKGFAQEVLGHFVVDEPFPEYDFSGLDDKSLASALGRLAVRRRLTEMDRALIYEAAVRMMETSCDTQPDPPATTS
jgi:hypothetical protein